MLARNKHLFFANTDWEDIEYFGHCKENFFRKYLMVSAFCYANGVSLAQYILALKNNQSELCQGVENTFLFQRIKEQISACEFDFGHGRIENRTCYISSNPENINLLKWKEAKTLIKIVSERYNKITKKQEEPTTRYYIASIQAEASTFNTMIRSHGGIENKLH